MSKNFRATPFEAGPQFFLSLILAAFGRLIEQSLKAPSAKGCNDATVSPAHVTSQANPTSGSICRFHRVSGAGASGAGASGSLMASCDSGKPPRKLS